MRARAAQLRVRRIQNGNNVEKQLTRVLRKQKNMGLAISHRHVKCRTPNADRALRRNDPIGALIACAGHEARGAGNQFKGDVLSLATAAE